MTDAGHKRIRTVLVDDEELARGILREMLTPHPEIEVVAECRNGFEAVKAVAELKPDLVFLDIQMPKLDGFEVLELIGSDMAIVFATAYDEYALRAFEVHAVDYLLKPFGQERFETALVRAKERVGKQGTTPPELVSSARKPNEYAERIVLRDGSNVHIIPVAKLEYAEAQDDYVALVSEGKKRLKQQTIAGLEASLDPKQFLRIHRSYVVNLERVTKVEPYGKDSKIAILADGTKLPVSRTGYARLREVLDAKS